ncbi:gamma-glutamyl-gamma-aminobutyrate hydrolase family protein [Phyllobacterium zundukense]|uniref:Gamma-glutamyl-gamma-aminobutyrate hydrolase family protein n=1 Tax=Phyllobacterium zundukense TaxID=1867719 RepID=A0ACD4CW07_9HYPH|nr:gamma-glutamyl-gamma-aminobutyrate hydrolase family protein [Phyllobacterium zundukense]UXN57648.1 gamma-glutamyl-gamma-aminobutyrate hydrolase family protein [Phyllobacterium zundukense]
MLQSVSPLVGISTCIRPIEGQDWHAVQDKYIVAMAVCAHLAPVLLPALGPDYAKSIISHLDGLFLTGSLSNVAPEIYGASQEIEGDFLDPKRDETAISLIKLAIQQDIPLFGVCRGLQELNVAFGGTLCARLHTRPDKIDHRATANATKDTRYGKAHSVSLAGGSLLSGLVGADTIEVNSLHEQGIDQLAANLEIEALAPDGVIEAVRVRDAGFAVAVQWHPEWHFWEDPPSQALFKAFGEAVQRRAYQRRRSAAQPLSV